MCPINRVSSEGFKNMVKVLDRRYVIPSRNYFSKVVIPALYEKRHWETKRENAAVENFTTTTDLWSSRTMEPYMLLTIHYIDNDFTMKSHFLQTSFFPARLNRRGYSPRTAGSTSFLEPARGETSLHHHRQWN